MPRTRCDGCSSFMNRAHKTIHTTEDRLLQYQAVFGSRATVGAKFCSKCSSVVNRAARQEASPNTAEAGPSGSRVSSQSSSSSSSHSDPMDVDYAASSSHETLEDLTEWIPMPFNRAVATEAYCFVCGSAHGRKRASTAVRTQVFIARRLFIPKSNRICEAHLIHGKLSDEDIMRLELAAKSSLMDKEDLIAHFEVLANEAGATIKDKVGNFSLTYEHIKLFTGLTYDELSSVASSLTSMRNVEGRSIIQALVIFLFKMRTGNSNAMVAGVFGLSRPQQVSEILDSIIKSFEKDVLPFRFGFSARSRSDLIMNETSDFVKALFGESVGLALIYDGTYLRHGKSANNCYQIVLRAEKNAPLQAVHDLHDYRIRYRYAETVHCQSQRCSNYERVRRRSIWFGRLFGGG